MSRQIDRVYSLIVGTEDDAVEINNLQITFNVTKTSSNKDKKNSASVEIYNLSEERRKSLEKPYVQVQLKVGYRETDMKTLFQGQVVNISSSGVKGFLTKRSGADLITKLDIDEFYEQMNAKFVSKIVPEGKTVKDAIDTVKDSIEGVTTAKFNGRNIETLLPNGYPLAGSPRMCLDRLSEEYDIDWQIDNTVLYISDFNGSHDKEKEGIPLIGQMSGLIGRPEYSNEDAKRYQREVEGKTPTHNQPKKNALKLRILLNPTIIAGSLIKLDFVDLSGVYKVSEVKHTGDFRGNDWYSDLTITGED